MIPKIKTDKTAQIS